MCLWYQYLLIAFEGDEWKPREYLREKQRSEKPFRSGPFFDMCTSTSTLQFDTFPPRTGRLSYRKRNKLLSQSLNSASAISRSPPLVLSSTAPARTSLTGYPCFCHHMLLRPLISSQSQNHLFWIRASDTKQNSRRSGGWKRNLQFWASQCKRDQH